MPITHYEKTLACLMSSYRESGYFDHADRAHVKEFTALEIYRKRERYLFAQGWKRLKTSQEYGIGQTHGYFGVGYMRVNSDNSVEVMIAHRGTTISQPGNIIADIEIAEADIPLPRIVLEGAIPYFIKLREDYFSLSQGVKILHTGFSLGGFIAGACAASTASADVSATTFDAPGISNVPMRNPLGVEAIENFVTEPNMVNTANKQVGAVKQVAGELESQNTTEEGVKFELEIANLGFSKSSQVDLMECRSTHDIRHALKVNALAGQKREDALTATKELSHTLRTHNLERIVQKLEQEGSTTIRYHDIYRWPHANNEFVYGDEPSIFSLDFLSVEGWGGVLLNLGYAALQGVQLGVANVLWHLTARTNDETGDREGIIAVIHKRKSNKIFYSREEYQVDRQRRHEQRAIDDAATHTEELPATLVPPHRVAVRPRLPAIASPASDERDREQPVTRRMMRS